MQPSPPVAKKKAAKAFTPRLQVTLRVGNEFEGKTFELIHQVDTLSKLLAEQEAVMRLGKNTDMLRWCRSSLCESTAQQCWIGFNLGP